jgi:hypothetical protein
MYYDLIKFPIQHESLAWEAREALLDVDNRPHLFLRVKLTGTDFPMIAQVPQVWAGKTFASKVTIDEDRRTVRAYFQEAPPRGEHLYFGHLGRPELDFGPVDLDRIRRLDRERLPDDVVIPRELTQRSDGDGG